MLLLIRLSLWIIRTQRKILQHLEEYGIDAPQNTLFTYIHFLAMETARWIEYGSLQRIMVTGGGTFNDTLFNGLSKDMSM